MLGHLEFDTIWGKVLGTPRLTPHRPRRGTLLDVGDPEGEVAATWIGKELLAADALEIVHVTRNDPVQYEGLREAYLPECQFRGRENRKIQYALLTSASVRGGLEPDLLDEVMWWQSDDYWRYALYAAVALIRASADRQGIPVAQLVEQLAERHGTALT